VLFGLEGADESVETAVETLVVEVEQALGPGVDFERGGDGRLLGARARSGGVWLGFDRASLLESDDGLGRRLPVVVAVPASTWAGSRLSIVLTGGWQTERGPTLLGVVPGAPQAVPDLARIAAGLDGRAGSLDREAARTVAGEAYQRYRERRNRARITGGRAWYGINSLPPAVARSGTPHSAAEYSLKRLPDRFLRGLQGLLDDEERILYWVERPMATDVSLLDRFRARLDRRAALLVLTDRQVLWIVDHANPNRYLEDWGIDVEVIPNERLIEARCSRRDGVVELEAVTPAGARGLRLPEELGEEVEVMRRLVARFTPAEAGRQPMRTYALEPIAFDAEAAARFGQEADARHLNAEAAQSGEVLAFLFSPRRPGHRTPSALVLRSTAVELLGTRPRRVALADVVAIDITLSPLVGRISMGRSISMTYPAPLFDRGAAFARLTRRALAGTRMPFPDRPEPSA
jgi:hypothetical protein